VPTPIELISPSILLLALSLPSDIHSTERYLQGYLSTSLANHPRSWSTTSTCIKYTTDEPVLSFSPTFTMERHSPRRQNTSCDPCRQTKRRCVISTQASNPSTKTVCNSCSYLDRNCTFNFANSRRTTASRRVGSNRDGPSATLERKDSNSPASNPGASEKRPHTGDGVPLNHETLVPEWCSSSNETTDPHTITGEHSPGGTEIYYDFIDNFEGMLHGNLETFPPENALQTSPYDCERKISNPAHLNIDNQMANISPSSPINLLNASLEANAIKQELGRIYETVMATATSSFLSHGSNPFATKWIYHFEGIPSSRRSNVADAGACSDGRNHGVCFSRSTEPYARPVPTSVGETYTSRCRRNGGLAEDTSQRVTMLGIASFLDNFAGLYGNVLDSHTIYESEMVLRDVIHVYSLQWVPCTKSTLPTSKHRDKDISVTSITRDQPSPAAVSTSLECSLSQGSQQPKCRPSTGASIFMDSWFKARNRLLTLNSSPSFKATYALLLFDMIVPPPQVDEASFKDLEPQHFLRVGLDYLSTLTGFVQSYCNNLGKTSLYSQLLQAGLQIFHWFGYVRDTTLAVMRDRSCLLPDALPENRQGMHSKADRTMIMTNNLI